MVVTKDVKRLYTQFKPKHYILDLKIDPDKMTFHGTVIISGHKVGRPSQRLTFHQNHLKITSAHLTKHDKKGDLEIEVDRINHHGSFDEVRLHAKHMLYPGLYTVRLGFSGTITRQMNGVYPCFFEHKGKDKKLTATQFESHHAREVFPCIDEPEAKATFDLNLTNPAGETVVSNTPIKEQKIDGQWQTTSFETTPHMSTYLLAFVAGDMAYKEAKTKHGVTVRTYATPDNVELTDFALDFAVKCLEFFEDYFAISYPLEKCDLLALPDFASGAMENWGCITFREQTLLVDPKNSALSSKQFVAMVVAHELAHQWFGNLVTMRWWTDLWLNEGFASWIEYMAVDHLMPEWEMWTQFVVDENQQALKLDALEHTHPVEVAVHHPDEIRSIFDSISYSKGASVIHMLHEYLGPVAFRDGLRHYLAKHKYNNTDTVDLWASLEEVSGRPVKSFMHHWTSQPGFPLLRATIDETGVNLEQERFFTNPKHAKLEHHSWPIPLLAHNEGVADTLTTRSHSFDVHNVEHLKFNRGQSGFYRTTYNATHLERLGELIRRGRLEPLDRLGILTDVFETAKAGHLDTGEALHFLTNFQHEDNYAVWDVIAGSIGSIRMVMDNEELRQNMKPFIRRLVAPQLARLGWTRQDNESHFDQLLRPIILGLAASADEPEVVERCLALFKSVRHPEEIVPDLRPLPEGHAVRSGIDIDPDIRGTVFGTVARKGGEHEFKKLLALHNHSKLSEERTTLSIAMTGFNQPEIIREALALITSDDVRLQDVTYWVAYSFLNRHGKRLTWHWLKTHWNWMHENLHSDMSFTRMPLYSARAFSDEAFIPEFQEFFQPHLTPSIRRSYHQGIEMLEWQSAWKQRALKEVEVFFENQKDL